MDDVDFSSLSKKERKKLKREIEKQEQEKKGKRTNIVKLLIIVTLLGVIGVGGWLVFRELSKPLPGQQFPDQGREHVGKEVWEKFAYNSNPPISGPHDATWIKAGVYDKEQGDGHLVHSLEHGYVIISYNCGIQVEQVEKATESGEATESDNLPKPLSRDECNVLKKQLADLANEKRLWKLIVVPRPNVDRRIAVTAWTRVDKMTSFEKDRIVSFIDAYRNNGPEKTME